MPHDVFISHSTDDKLVALALCNKLESAGVRCWIAPRDVGPGAEWGKAIVDAISSCRLMVLVFSSKANESRHIRREVQTAFEKDLIVIPFRVENTQPTGTMEYYLGSVHWLDALTPPVESHLIGVVERVKALLPAAVPEPAAPLSAPSPPIFERTGAQPPRHEIRVAEGSSPEATQVPPNEKVPASIPAGSESVAPLAPPRSPTVIPNITRPVRQETQAAEASRPLPTPSSPARKLAPRILMGVVGLIAIVLGVRQIISGLHLMSHQPTAKTQPEARTPVSEFKVVTTGCCSFEVPNGWEQEDLGEGTMQWSAPNPTGGTFNEQLEAAVHHVWARLSVGCDSFAGSLRQYADSRVSTVKAKSPKAQWGSVAAFTTDSSASDYKVVFRNKISGEDFTETLYFLEGKDGKKVTLFTMTSVAQAPQFEPLFDRSVKRVVLF
jgi:hypothetical protein